MLSRLRHWLSLESIASEELHNPPPADMLKRGGLSHRFFALDSGEQIVAHTLPVHIGLVLRRLDSVFNLRFTGLVSDFLNQVAGDG